ncbi:histidine phosphatase family protein [Bradyrhizobium sp. 83012]|uniref:Histidine phosphatase family protein n=1 Tax=Bradyrhizobium aeschynomenes TaxID=2734909 RepID=A0ABX2CBQ0_9BRAD|nr:histidine phosphatase family protein [Bradyrhizobium aeschynomenes]NPU65656.1 histidine phosphatase family protein [Bradyrhizobium aeschynomenes]NPV23526.1 histidine phosphatase family protein [Bradyrhizobium aeschynomenes]
MTTTIHLIRHGHHPLLRRVLCGRMPGVELDEQGCREVEMCAALIDPIPSLIQSSPQLRAQQTAGLLAARYGLPVEIAPALDELDAGDWTGRSFAELDADPDWRRWNAQRGSCAPPNGESMASVQQRIVAHIEHLCREHADACIVLTSHAEPIRAAIMHYARIPFDDFLSIEVAPASISTLVADSTGLKLSQANRKVPV